MTRRQRWNLRVKSLVYHTSCLRILRSSLSRPPTKTHQVWIWRNCSHFRLQRSTPQMKTAPHLKEQAHTNGGYSATYSARESGDRASEGVVRRGLPHVSIADGGHRYDCPPKGIGYGGKIGTGAIFISKENGTGEHDHSCEDTTDRVRKYVVVPRRAPALPFLSCPPLWEFLFGDSRLTSSSLLDISMLITSTCCSSS